jgi:HEAT repeat protein
LLAALPWSAAGRDVLAQVATGHDDADLRAEAARVLGGVTGAQDVLGRVLHDRVPRVRAAAAAGLRPDDTHRAVLEAALRDDPWPTVRAAAARSLAGDAGAVPALLAALDQGSFTVVGAALDALGQAPGTAPGVTARLLAFVGDHARNPDLRRAAADAVGARCDPAAAVPLEQLAEAFSEPGLPPFEEEVGHTVMAALARTDPARARAFVTRNGSNAAAAAAVEAAIRGGCAAGAGSR